MLLKIAQEEERYQWRGRGLSGRIRAPVPVYAVHEIPDYSGAGEEAGTDKQLVTNLVDLADHD